jgi:hypothetical protein
MQNAIGTGDAEKPKATKNPMLVERIKKTDGGKIMTVA